MTNTVNETYDRRDPHDSVEDVQNQQDTEISMSQLYAMCIVITTRSKHCLEQNEWVNQRITCMWSYVVPSLRIKTVMGILISA